MSEHASSLSLEAYNARWLTASQVASTFVPPFQFGQLAKHCHTILVGPRGSGKTTLLKMLQPSALERWVGQEAAWFRERIDYTGVFIPSDISWREQLDAASLGILEPELGSLFSNAAFTTHILQALIETMYFRISSPSADVSMPFKRCAIDKEKEAQIVGEIARTLHAKPTIPTLLSLKHAMTSRLAEIHSIAQKTVRLGMDADLRDYEFLYTDALTAAGLAIQVFDDVCGDPDGKWALLFDELEIAPDRIQNRLIAGTRSTNPKFLFKLALSPFSSHVNATGVGGTPSPGNDYDQIQLWYAHKEQGGASKQKRKFCISLWESMVQNRGGISLIPSNVFGEGFFDIGIESSIPAPGQRTKKNVNPYGPTGKWGSCFIRLYQNDPTFKVYLDERKIDPTKILGLPTPVRDSAIRKVTPIVAVRDFFRRPQLIGDQGVRERSRKGVELYTGADALIDISEGHPRWFKVTMGRLLDHAKGSSTLRVSPAAQGQELLASAQRFTALLKTFPVEQSAISNSNRGLLSLIERIAGFFRDQVVKAPFSPEPYLSFTVDSHVSEGLLRSLAQALNLGAIVYIPDGDGEVLLTSLKGKRFRISYWLAPLYGLPLILGKPISLSKILAEKNSARVGITHGTMELPFDSEHEA